MASDYGGDADGGVAAEIQRRFGHSAQPESQQVAVTLQAITDVIKNEGLPLSPTSYFAATMSALEQPSTQNSRQVYLTEASLRLPFYEWELLELRFWRTLANPPPCFCYKMCTDLSPPSDGPLTL